MRELLEAMLAGQIPSQNAKDRMQDIATEITHLRALGAQVAAAQSVADLNKIAAP